MTARLVFEHQSTWYDYTKMKFRDNREIKDPQRIKNLIAEASEEIDFVENMLKLKKR